MQGNTGRRMQEWRQLTDFICSVPVTCWSTFSSSFSMRWAQWIILEAEHLERNIVTSGCFCLISLLQPVFFLLFCCCFLKGSILAAIFSVAHCLKCSLAPPSPITSWIFSLGSANSSCAHLGPTEISSNKTAQVWQKCTLSWSWSLLDRAKSGIKRSNGWGSSLDIYQQATNDLMDWDFFSR